MFVVTVVFKILPAHADAFLEAVRMNAARSLADEPGCHRFDVCVDPGTPHEVFLYELYDDAAAFDLHLQTPHFIDFSDRTNAWVSDKTVRTFVLADPA